MIDIKKLEEKEVVFSNVKPTEKEDIEFSKFLKERKLKKKNSKQTEKSESIKNTAANIFYVKKQAIF